MPMKEESSGERRMGISRPLGLVLGALGVLFLEDLRVFFTSPSAALAAALTLAEAVAKGLKRVDMLLDIRRANLCIFQSNIKNKSMDDICMIEWR